MGGVGSRLLSKLVIWLELEVGLMFFLVYKEEDIRRFSLFYDVVRLLGGYFASLVFFIVINFYRRIFFSVYFLEFGRLVEIGFLVYFKVRRVFMFVKVMIISFV